MKKISKLSVYFLLLILLFNLTACKQKVENSSQAAITKINASGWEFIIEDFQISDALKDISTAVNYGGVSTSNEVSEEPKPGKVFLLIKMSAEKKEGSETIDWNKMSVVDSSGNTYTRLYDSFLESFGFKRMKGTTLSFGKSEGWIAFEVNDDSKGFKLQYEFSEGIISLDLKN